MKDGSDELYLALIVAVVAFAVAGIFNIIVDASISSEAIKAGLQQCVIENKTVWQKECSK